MKGMDEFMRLKIAHRDIKHENFVLHFPSAATVDILKFDFLGKEPWFVKIADLGFAKEIEETTATVCGSPVFIAPEILKKERYNSQCDVWSLGVTYYYLLTK
jgi:serine/threonine-protein kinase ULK/ATG1